jgi:hypothetical protein
MLKNRKFKMFGVIVLILAAILVTISAVNGPSPTLEDANEDSAQDASNPSEQALVPVTGENISNTSNNEAQTTNNVPAYEPNIMIEENQILRTVCVLDGNLPRHVGGCADFYSPDLKVEMKVPSASCSAEDDLSQHHTVCVE